MSVQDTVDLLQALHASIQGVAAAPQFAEYPGSADTFNLPLVLTWPTGDDFYAKGGGAGQSVTTYSVVCWVAPVAQNDLPSNLIMSIPLYDRFRRAYTNVESIRLATPPPDQATIESAPDGIHHSSDGIRSDVMYGGKPYHGFIFQVKVREYWK